MKLHTTLLFLLGCASTTSCARSDAPAEPPATVVPVYREVDRSYERADQLDLAGCLASYRFLDGNWMDCVAPVSEPYAVEPLQQVISSSFPSQSVDLATEDPGVVLSVTVASACRTYEECSRGLSLALTASYARPGDGRIYQAPAESYSPAIFERAVRRALGDLGRAGALHVRIGALAGARYEHPLAHDTLVGGLYVGRVAVALDPAACVAAYETPTIDNWPDEDYSVSRCVVSRASAPRDELPPSSSVWSARLDAADAEREREVTLPTDDRLPGGNPVVHVAYDRTGSYTATLGLRRAGASSADFRVAIAAEIGRELIATGLQQLGTLSAPVLLREADLATLGSNEELLGLLVRRDGLLDVQ